MVRLAALLCLCCTSHSAIMCFGLTRICREPSWIRATKSQTPSTDLSIGGLLAVACGDARAHAGSCGGACPHHHCTNLFTVVGPPPPLYPPSLYNPPHRKQFCGGGGGGGSDSHRRCSPNGLAFIWSSSRRRLRRVAHWLRGQGCCLQPGMLRHS